MTTEASGRADEAVALIVPCEPIVRRVDSRSSGGALLALFGGRGLGPQLEVDATARHVEEHARFAW